MKNTISCQAAIDKFEKELSAKYNRREFAIGFVGIKSILENLPSAQPTYTDVEIQKMQDLEQAQIEKAYQLGYEDGEKDAQPEQRWIPFKTRSLTEEEKEEHPEWDCILDCILPDDGQAILVNINLRGHERVQYDEFYTDDGSYLDSGYEIGSEATAWMPLPEPYKEEGGG